MIADRQSEDAKRIWIVALAATLFGFFLALLGPFGTYLNGGLAYRTAYWVGSMWLGLAVYAGVFRGGLAIGRRAGLSAWFAVLAALLLGSLVMTAATRLAAFALWPELAGLGLGLVQWYFQVLVIAAPVVAAHAFATGAIARRPRSQGDAPGPEDAIPGAGGLLARIPAHLGRDLVCLQMEDHYVRVHTMLGSVLLLMPLGQAIAEAAPIEGLRTHRSWWVVRDAVVRAEGGPRAMRLHLADGQSAPVSRSAIASLRASGWLDQPAPRNPVPIAAME